MADLNTTFDLPNFVGPLFHLTPSTTPFLSMVGGLTGGERIMSKDWTWQTDANETPSADGNLEGADPTYRGVARTEVANTLTIFQYGISVTYTKSAAVGQLGAYASDRDWSILGNQPVQSEMAHQLDRVIKQAGRDVNYAFHNSAFAKPADNATARKTRGMLAAISTNSTDGTLFDTAQEMVDGINAVAATLAGNGSMDDNVVMFVNSDQKQRITQSFTIKGLTVVPRERTIGGVAVDMVLTDFGWFNIVYDRDVPTDTIAFYNVGVVKPKFLEIPGKGHFFVEPLAKTGSKDKAQMYGEIGVEYGPETWHAKIHSLPTAAITA